MGNAAAASSGTPAGILTVHGAGEQISLPPDRPFVVGRAIACDLVVNDGRVSRRHLMLEPSPDGWTAIDISAVTVPPCVASRPGMTWRIRSMVGRGHATGYCSIGMKQALKPVWGIFLVLLAVVGANLVWKATRPKEIIPWRASYAAALDEGRAAKKPVFVYFTADWCGPCQGLKHTTWADPSVEAALREYVPVKVDVDRDAQVAQKYRVTGIPAYFVLDPAGSVVGNWDGAQPPVEFLQELKRVAASARAGT